MLWSKIRHCFINLHYRIRKILSFAIRCFNIDQLEQCFDRKFVIVSSISITGLKKYYRLLLDVSIIQQIDNYFIENNFSCNSKWVQVNNCGCDPVSIFLYLIKLVIKLVTSCSHFPLFLNKISIHFADHLDKSTVAFNTKLPSSLMRQIAKYPHLFSCGIGYWNHYNDLFIYVWSSKIEAVGLLH